LIEDNVFDAVGRQYSTAIAEVAECQPLLIPLGASMTDIGAVLEVADAILLSGSKSNIAPKHYGTEEPLRPDAADPERDALTLPLIRAAVERRTPLFAICRGFQELNVALGGSLYQARTSKAIKTIARTTICPSMRCTVRFTRCHFKENCAIGSAATRSWSIRCIGKASRASPTA
jgi:gamma-glutamyl-gamma-aminobutyrate hydrolase PuuD